MSAARLTPAARRDLDALRRGEPVDLRYGPWRQLVDAGLIVGPQHAPRPAEPGSPQRVSS